MSNIKAALLKHEHVMTMVKAMVVLSGFLETNGCDDPKCEGCKSKDAIIEELEECLIVVTTAFEIDMDDVATELGLIMGDDVEGMSAH